jgi:dihydrofolate synthase/folylpolyglutamate synthase
MINASTAIALAEALRKPGFPISSGNIIVGLEKAKHPGRLELWESEPPILFDGAHNPAAARALRDYLDEFIHQPITLVFGAMGDKALREMAAILFPAVENVILTELDNPRGATIEQQRSAVPANFDSAKIHEAASVDAALQIAKDVAGATSLILVTGSLYLVGAARARMKQRPPFDTTSQSHVASAR